MAFGFHLDIVLRLRRSLERQQELLLQAAHHEFHKTEQQIRNLEAWRKALERNEIESLKSGTAAAELLFHDIVNSAAAKHQQDLQKQLMSLEQVREERRAALEQARRNREMIENLRDQQFHAYRMEQTRKGQRAMDYFFLMRRNNPARAGNGCKK